MQPRYNAFISYRHHPQDIRVASQIHRLLERFHVPKALRKQSKGITRLFRDKDELPITSNLSDDITAALRDSDYLIVICSTHTKESVWVQREIETFLQTHHRSKVLTVLVDGEPCEVIPEVLLYEEVTDSQTGETHRIDLEPLSCDWRVSRRQAIREELPRLAAPLLHCSYDELRQRQKQYRMHRLIAFFTIALTASLALSAYFLHTTITIHNANIQIQKNLDQALRNQSRYLATAAQEQADAGDNLTALALLQEALPSEGNPRPYVAEAERVLAEILGVYSSEQKMAARGTFSPSNTATISEFLVSDRKDRIFLLDSRNIITAWNTDTLLLEHTIEPQLPLADLRAVTKAGNLLVQFDDAGGDVLCCLRPDGELLWQLDHFTDLAFQQEEEILLVLTWLDGENRILKTLDPDTGKQLRTDMALPKLDTGESAAAFAMEQFPEDQPVLLQYRSGTTALCLLDPETQAPKLLLHTKHALRDVCTTEDGTIFAMVSDGSGMMNGTVGNMVTSSPSRSDIFCFDCKTGRKLWQSEIVTFLYTRAHTIAPVPGTDYLFCQSGNTLQLLTQSTGTQISRCETTNGVAEVVQITERNVLGILQDGYVFDYNFERNECNAINYNLQSNVRQASMLGGLYTLSASDTQVTAYSFRTVQYAWEDPDSSDVVWDLRIRGDRIAFRGRDNWYIYDVRRKQEIWQQPKGNWTLLDFSEDGGILWAKDVSSTLLAFDITSGSCETYALPREKEGSLLTFRTDPQQIRGSFWYLVSCDQQLWLAHYQPQTQKTSYYPLANVPHEIPAEVSNFAESIYVLESILQQMDANDGLTDTSRAEIQALIDSLAGFLAMAENAAVLTVTEQYAFVITGNGDLFQIALDSGEKKLLDSGFSGVPVFTLRPQDGTLLVARDNEIRVFTPGAEDIQSIVLPEGRAGSLHFLEDELLVLCDIGCVFRFGTDGNLLSRTELVVSSQFGSNLLSPYNDPLDITWQTAPDNKLVLFAFGLANIIDCHSWESCGYVPYCFSYHPGTDCFLYDSPEGLRAYPRYSLEELLHAAQIQLGNYVLSQEDKNALGID